MIENQGQKVKREREKRGWSQEYLANLADTTAPTISRIESDIHQPRRKTLKKIAEALGRPVTYFSPSEKGSNQGIDQICVPRITPQDQVLYEKRIMWANQIVPKYPSFNHTTDSYYLQIYLRGSPEDVRMMEDFLKMLADKHEKRPVSIEEKRGRPTKRGNGVK